MPSKLAEIEPILSSLPRFGFLPLESTTAGLVPTQAYAELLNRHYVDHEALNQTLGGRLRGAIIAIGVASNRNNSRAYFEWAEFIGGTKKIGLIVTLERHPQRAAVDALAEHMKLLAQHLYEAAQPTYIRLWDPDREGPAPLAHDVAKLKMSVPGWISYFGPEYVEKYGLDSLRFIPHHQFVPLADGGAMFESRPSFFIDTQHDFKKWQRQVLNYLTKI